MRDAIAVSTKPHHRQTERPCETSGSDWLDVSDEELSQTQQYGICIDWSPEDEVFIASVPVVPFVRAPGAMREEAAERGK